MGGREGGQAADEAAGGRAQVLGGLFSVFLCLGLCWIFLLGGLSLVVACGLLIVWLLLLQSMGSGALRLR